MIELRDGVLLVEAPKRDEKLLKAELGAKATDDYGGDFYVPPTSLNVLRLVELYGEGILEGSPEEVRDLAEQPWGFRGFSLQEEVRAESHPSWFELYDFQREGVEYLVCNPHAAGMVGLSWGLGKAATSIVAADIVDARRVLVLAPLTLAKAWGKEIDRWSVDATHHRATSKDRSPADSGWTIANHEVIQEVVLRDEDGKIQIPEWVKDARKVKAWIEAGPKKENAKGKLVPARERVVRVHRDYLAQEWDLIIVDESVMLKNRRAVKADVLKKLRKRNAPFVWLLSASPTTKYRDDLHKQLEIMYPKGFTSYWRTAEFFCYVDKDGWGWTIEGDRPDRDPHHYLRDLIWMKSEEEAGLELPEYHESVVELEATPKQRKALDSMFEDWIVELEDEPDQTVVADTWLARITRLQQITSNMGALPKPRGGYHAPSSAKAQALMDLIRQSDVQMPLLTWTWYVETSHLLADQLVRTFPDLEVAVVTGESKNKDDLLEAFAEGELDVLCLQMGVGKFGHTFTKTRSIYYHDRTFDSDAYVQSRRRVRRIGLEHNPVLLVPKIANSADELIDANLEGKLRSISNMTNANLAELLRSVQNKEE